MNGKKLLITIVLSAAGLLASRAGWSAAPDFSEIEAVVAKQHDEGVRRLQEWIRLPSIAAEDRGFPAGAEHMVSLLKWQNTAAKNR